MQCVVLAEEGAAVGRGNRILNLTSSWQSPVSERAAERPSGRQESRRGGGGIFACRKRGRRRQRLRACVISMAQCYTCPEEPFSYP